MDNSKYIELLSNLQEEYYKNNNKKIIFKNKQKIDCATTILQQTDLSELLNNTIFIIPETNRIYIDYRLFKKFANPTILGTISLKLIETLNICKRDFGKIEIYVNFEQLTVSAFERYKDLLIIFSKMCIENNLLYSDYIDKCVIINSPNVINTLRTLVNPFLTVRIKSIIEFPDKEESSKVINDLFGQKS